MRAILSSSKAASLVRNLAREYFSNCRFRLYFRAPKYLFLYIFDYSRLSINCRQGEDPRTCLTGKLFSIL